MLLNQKIRNIISMSDSDLFSESDNEDVFVPATPVSKEKKNSSRKKVKPIQKREIPPKLPDRKQPFIHYTLKEILNFTHEFAPLNNKIRTIGIYEEKGMHLQYLVNTFGANQVVLKVLVDLKLVKVIPRIGKQIQAFGFIHFKYLERSRAHIPVLVVQFWNQIEGDVSEFVNRLQKLQTNLLLSNHGAVTNLDSTYLEATASINVYFDEINDTALNEAANGAENICKELMERLNVSEDLFE